MYYRAFIFKKVFIDKRNKTHHRIWIRKLKLRPADSRGPVVKYHPNIPYDWVRVESRSLGKLVTRHSCFHRGSRLQQSFNLTLRHQHYYQSYYYVGTTEHFGAIFFCQRHRPFVFKSEKDSRLFFVLMRVRILRNM